MISIPLKFGNHALALTISDPASTDIIYPPRILAEKPGFESVQDALQNPVSPLDLVKLRSAKQVVVAINDKTRPVPYRQILPPLLKFLSAQGISSDRILYLVATGTHTPLSQQELEKLLPSDLRSNSLIICHDCDQNQQIISVGKTPSGTRVEINRTFYEADYKIVIGSIEPHHFMGYSGGVKTAAIGLASRLSIRQNHAHLTSPLSHTGNYETNPCRIDVEEMGKLIGIDLAVNVILNTNKEIIATFAGDPLAVIKNGIPISQKNSQVKIEQKYDLVVVSPGGYPKDINFYQAHKAITNAAAMTNDGGRVILIAECVEGPGSLPFQEYMKGKTTPDQVLESFMQTGFEIGPHKAFLLARQLKRIEISLLSSMPDELVHSLLVEPITLKEIRRLIESKRQQGSRIAILPYGVNTVPQFLE